jgi:hypothetical protein
MSNSKVILNTLLELYINSFSDPFTKKKLGSNKNLIDELKMDSSSPPSVSSIKQSATTVASLKEKKALEFLTSNYSLYDTNLALGICQLHNFKPGLLFLYEKNGMYLRILQFYMETNDYINILDTCKRYGTHDSNLWIQALQYFSKKEEYNCNEYITQILANIEKFNLLSPLMVIKILSQNSTLTVDTVKVIIYSN